MSSDQVGETGTWRQKQILGQGGFGCVDLWYNEETGEHIAIKRCKLKDDMREKMWEHWKMEVYIMGKLNHDNVIKAVTVPLQLEPDVGEPPVLAMEFCEGGDLRKVLNLPGNCYGLPEREIRQLVTGVGSAIEYLHSNRIIHRDLKPENIVLKHVEDNRTLYKIIDLGYAKELDINSICESFVGTVPYLAPELFISKPYSKTVDYWSFGSLVFECISGFRPFLPTAPPVEWHSEVCKKSPDDISAQYDENKQIKFSKKLPLPNQLCKPLQNYFEQWLRLMLRWDPKARGGGIIQVVGGERSKCFYLIEQIMALTILHILHVEANSILSYPVNNHIQLPICKKL
uniref:IkappaB kinase n=1 Tax=Arion vulgaris TaxID=1028688 RepID=A0A0B6ZML0_9EUPU